MLNCLLAAVAAVAACPVPASPAVMSVSQGDILLLESSWNCRDVPRSIFVRPHLVARDAAGRQVWRGNVGTFYQRAFDPERPHVQKWNAYARVRAEDPEAEKASVARYRPEGLHGVVLPPAAAQVELMAIAEGAEPGVRPWRDESNAISRIEGKMPPVRMKFPPLPCDGIVALDDAALDARLAARVKDRIELETVGDRTVAKLNGKPFLPRIYKTGEKADDPDARRVPAVFSKYGFNLFVVKVDLAENADAGAPGRVRAELRERLRYAPDAHFMLAIGMTPWEGWGESHPSEIFRDEAGRYGIMLGVRVREFADAPRTYRGPDRNMRRPAVSYASTLFAAEAGEAAARIIRHLEQTPEGKALAGIYIGGGGDGQWFDLFDQWGDKVTGDYSDAARKGFREYLKMKYGDRADPDAQIPPSKAFWTPRAHYSEHGPSMESDYREFMAYATARFTGIMSTALRKACGGRLLIGGYCSNGGLSGFPKICLSCTRFRLAADDGWDFTSIVPSYAREYADPVMPSIYEASHVRRGRLYIGEMDIRNPEADNWKYWGSAIWKANHTPATFRTEVLKHVLANVTAGGGYHAYDMNGDWYSTPAAMETWRVAAEVADHARPMPLMREGIALVGGERYFEFQSFGDQMGRLLSYAIRDNVQRAMAYSGLPHAKHLVDEVVADPSAVLPGVVVFNDLTCITPVEFAELRRRYAKDRRVLVYTWRLGLFAAGGEKVEESLGLKPSGHAGRFIRPLASVDDPLMAGISGRMVASYAPWGVAKAEGLVPSEGSGWKELARFEDSDVGGLFVRRSKDFTEVYLAHPAALTPALCRNMAREAGFEPLLDTDDPSDCGSGIFWFVAQFDGVRRFRVPPGYRPGKVLVGPEYSAADGVYSVPMKTAGIFAVTLER